MMGKKAFLLFLCIAVAVVFSFSACAENEEEKTVGLMMNYYKDTCPQAEDIIREQVKLLYKRHKNTAFSWLRNLFHDCGVQVYTRNFTCIFHIRTSHIL